MVEIAKMCSGLVGVCNVIFVAFNNVCAKRFGLPIGLWVACRIDDVLHTRQTLHGSKAFAVRLGSVVS